MFHSIEYCPTRSAQYRGSVSWLCFRYRNPVGCVTEFSIINAGFDRFLDELHKTTSGAAKISVTRYGREIEPADLHFLNVCGQCIEDKMRKVFLKFSPRKSAENSVAADPADKEKKLSFVFLNSMFVFLSTQVFSEETQVPINQMFAESSSQDFVTLARNSFGFSGTEFQHVTWNPCIAKSLEKQPKTSTRVLRTLIQHEQADHTGAATWELSGRNLGPYELLEKIESNLRPTEANSFYEEGVPLTPSGSATGSDFIHALIDAGAHFKNYEPVAVACEILRYLDADAQDIRRFVGFLNTGGTFLILENQKDKSSSKIKSFCSDWKGSAVVRYELQGTDESKVKKVVCERLEDAKRCTETEIAKNPSKSWKRSLFQYYASANIIGTDLPLPLTQMRGILTADFSLGTVPLVQAAMRLRKLLEDKTQQRLSAVLDSSTVSLLLQGKKSVDGGAEEEKIPRREKDSVSRSTRIKWKDIALFAAKNEGRATRAALETSLRDRVTNFGREAVKEIRFVLLDIIEKTVADRPRRKRENNAQQSIHLRNQTQSYMINTSSTYLIRNAISVKQNRDILI